MDKAIVVIVTTLILAGLGVVLRNSFENGSWWWLFPAVWACIFAGIWYMGEDEDRDILRRMWRAVTLRSWRQ